MDRPGFLADRFRFRFSLLIFLIVNAFQSLVATWNCGFLYRVADPAVDNEMDLSISLCGLPSCVSPGLCLLIVLIQGKGRACLYVGCLFRRMDVIISTN